MPHLIVRPFESALLDPLLKEGTLCKFRGVEEKHNVELLGVEYEGESFILELKKRTGDLLIRPDKISRPLDVGRIKRALGALAQRAGLEILHSNIEHRASKPPLAEEAEKKIRDFESIEEFPREKVALEVGFGSGRHLLWQAKRAPETLFIGVEIHAPSIQQVLRQIRLQGLENVWMLNYDARLLLEMLPSNLLEKIYVHFPVPWDKKPHRRVISDRFVQEASRVLRPGGELELRTDSENYYRYALAVFSTPLKSEFRVEKNRDLPVVSKYEARWRKMEKNIYTLTMCVQEESPSSRLEGNFELEPPQNWGKIETLPKRPLLGKDHFVHFGHRYRFADESGGVIECAFGSFERPEHKYLLWREGEGIGYFPDLPVRSASNLKAHQTIGATLHG